MWISAHSMTLQDLMKMTANSTPDQLRLKGMKAEVCLDDLVSEPTRSSKDQDNNLHPHLMPYTSNWEQFVSQSLYSQLDIRQTTN